jgi:hypothetical protein
MIPKSGNPMAPDAADSSTSSPLLSVWLNPRRVVDGILSTNFSRHVLLLAALGAISEIAAQLVLASAVPTALPDWRVIAAVILIGAAAGILASIWRPAFSNGPATWLAVARRWP